MRYLLKLITTSVLLCLVLAFVSQAQLANTKIAFQSKRDGNGEIYVMNTDGSSQTRLTSNTSKDGGPSWSPDGTKIAFWSERNGNYDIYVMNTDGTKETRLTTNAAEDSNPSWSPDGTKIAFHSNRDGNFEIYVMNADGTNQTRLSNNPASDVNPSWSPDGTKIAFNSRRDGNDEVYVMGSDGSNQTRLTNNSADDSIPFWSPDGTKIAFNSFRDGNWEIYVMNTDRSSQTRLTNNTALDLNPSWSPDGTKIAFHSDRDLGGEINEIYVMDAEDRDGDGNGDNLTRLTNNSAVDQLPSWSPFLLLIVSIDIKPGSWPNAINPNNKGLIPVAILTTANFGATTVDPSSVKFGPSGAAEAHGKGHVEDVDGDGDLDLLLHFNTQETGIKAGDTETCLTGKTVDGKDIKGCDTIVTVPQKAPSLNVLTFSLGQNFSNPFNPETWIPYSLAKDVEVTIRIYNVSGLLIRTLDLGHKTAGYYTSKDRAAYWDGRNDYGERVSSGIYFYNIQAGAYTATRKMLLLK